MLGLWWWMINLTECFSFNIFTLCFLVNVWKIAVYLLMTIMTWKQWWMLWVDRWPVGCAHLLKIYSAHLQNLDLLCRQLEQSISAWKSTIRSRTLRLQSDFLFSFCKSFCSLYGNSVVPILFVRYFFRIAGKSFFSMWSLYHSALALRPTEDWFGYTMTCETGGYRCFYGLTIRLVKKILLGAFFPSFVVFTVVLVTEWYL